MTIRKLKGFQKDYDKLPSSIKEKVKKQLGFLVNSPSHPSLQIHKVQGTDDILEGYIDYHYRITFRTEGDLLILRRVGTHEVLRKP